MKKFQTSPPPGHRQPTIHPIPHLNRSLTHAHTQTPRRHRTARSNALHIQKRARPRPRDYTLEGTRQRRRHEAANCVVYAYAECARRFGSSSAFAHIIVQFSTRDYYEQLKQRNDFSQCIFPRIRYTCVCVCLQFCARSIVAPVPTPIRLSSVVCACIVTKLRAVFFRLAEPAATSNAILVYQVSFDASARNEEINPIIAVQ